MEIKTQFTIQQREKKNSEPMEGKTDQFDNLKSKQLLLFSKPKKFHIKTYHKQSQNSIFKLGEKNRTLMTKDL